MTPTDWRTVSPRYSDELLRTGDWRIRIPTEARAARWMGFGPASEGAIGEAERWLGRQLPPSLRTFYLVTNGWRATGFFIADVLPVEQVGWLKDRDPHLYRMACDTEGHCRPFKRDPDGSRHREYVLEQGMRVKRSLAISSWGDAAIWLLDPGDAPARRGMACRLLGLMESGDGVAGRELRGVNEERTGGLRTTAGQARLTRRCRSSASGSAGWSIWCWGGGDAAVTPATSFRRAMSMQTRIQKLRDQLLAQAPRLGPPPHVLGRRPKAVGEVRRRPGRLLGVPAGGRTGADRRDAVHGLRQPVRPRVRLRPGDGREAGRRRDRRRRLRGPVRRVRHQAAVAARLDRRRRHVPADVQGELDASPPCGDRRAGRPRASAAT